MTEPGERLYFQGDHIVGQTLAMACAETDQFKSVTAVVHEKMRTAGIQFPPCGGKCPDPLKDMLNGRCIVGNCAGWTDSRATSASGAGHRIDNDMVPCRRDRAGRAKIEAACAAGLLCARVRTKLFVQLDVDRFFECAGELRSFEYGLYAGLGIAGIGSQISFPLVRCRKKRLDRPAEIQNNVAFSPATIARFRPAEGSPAPRNALL